MSSKVRSELQEWQNEESNKDGLSGFCSHDPEQRSSSEGNASDDTRNNKEGREVSECDQSEIDADNSYPNREDDASRQVNFQQYRGTGTSQVIYQICCNPWFNLVFLIIAVIDNVRILLQAETNALSKFSSFYTEVVFASAYLLQALIMVASGRFGSLLRESIFNRLDLVATACAWVQIAVRNQGVSLSLCSLRLLRLMRPLTRYRAFAVLDAILRTLNSGWASIGTILALIIISIILLGVVGVYAYAGSFRRRCVWADNLEIKIPEQWCTR